MDIRTVLIFLTCIYYVQATYYYYYYTDAFDKYGDCKASMSRPAGCSYNSNSVRNGRVYATKGTNYGSVMRCKCNTGYQLKYNYYYTCSSRDRKWHKNGLYGPAFVTGYYFECIKNIPKKCAYNSKSYNSGTTFNDGCKTCYCNNGIAKCSTKTCPLPCKVGSVTYQSGQRYTSDCNTCVCTNGRVVCTEIVCYQPCNHNGKTYDDGEDFQVGCNTCTCDNGQVSCTKNTCPKPCHYTINWFAHQATFSNDCNTCTCNDGKVSCTTNTCPKKCTYKGNEYHSGETCTDDCNTCSCHYGVETCTNITCFAPCEYKGSVVDHNAVFADDCNRCVCLDGDVKCTEKKCDPCEGVYCAKMTCNTYLPAGHCCELCEAKCNYNGEVYDSGDSWDHDCNECTCTNGKVTCTEDICNPCLTVRCANPDCDDTYVPDGACCPVCICKDSKGNSYGVGDDMPSSDPCQAPCECGSDGKRSCEHIDCPSHDKCYNYTVPVGQCCGNCEPGCPWKEQVVKEGSQFKDGPCKTCECTSGEVICASAACEEPKCPYGATPKVKEGECCTTC